MVQSPCNKICTLNAEGVCVGCGRTRAEIGAWSQISDADRAKVVKKAKERLAAMGVKGTIPARAS
jgi:predicted Fe-S protein YdhL (DUF1289 family)